MVPSSRYEPTEKPKLSVEAVTRRVNNLLGLLLVKAHPGSCCLPGRSSSLSPQFWGSVTSAGTSRSVNLGGSVDVGSPGGPKVPFKYRRRSSLRGRSRSLTLEWSFISKPFTLISRALL